MSVFIPGFRNSIPLFETASRQCIQQHTVGL